MEDPVADAILNQYFRRLEQALGLLPAERREQIVQDLRAHIEDALGAESDRSETTVLSVLDRVGDPDEIAREALADAADGDAVATSTAQRAGLGTASGTSAPTAARAARRLRLLAPATVALAVVVVAILTLTGGSSASPPNRAPRDPGGALAARNGWLPSIDVSGGGGVDAFRCSPQTMTGSESTATVKAGATQVGSGSIDGHSWTLWAKNGHKGGPGLEQGGVIIDGVAHGLCDGFPNPAEMELLDPNHGGHAIAYGVVGYPGAAKVDIYTSAAGTFDTRKLVGSTTSRVANGVGFFITSLSESGCDLPALELNTASSSYATEHNFGFATSHCSTGQLVPINDSQGIWQLPSKDFPNHYGSGGGGGLLAGGPLAARNGWLPSIDVSGGGGVDAFRCSPQTMTGSESTATVKAGATQVGSGSIDGHSWTLWAKNGHKGGPGLEQGGVIIDGVAHGLCDGFPNPAEMELLDPNHGGHAIAYGVVGYPGAAKVDIYTSAAGTFDTRKLVGSTTSRVANGVGFFITSLSESGCDLPALELNTASSSYATEHNFGFATSHCSTGQLVPINDSQGIWQLPSKDFPNAFQSANGGLSPGVLARTGVLARARALSRAGALSQAGGLSPAGPDFSSCSPATDAAASGSVANSIAGASEVASGTIGGHSWTLWSRRGETGSAALEDAGVILDGHAYGLCPGFPNPAELELIAPARGGSGIVIGVSGYNGAATAKVFVGTPNTSNAGTLLYSGHTVSADGTGFFIGQLSKSACDYRSLELRVEAASGASQHNLEFGSCNPGKLVTITGSMGQWSASG